MLFSLLCLSFFFSGMFCLVILFVCLVCCMHTEATKMALSGETM